MMYWTDSLAAPDVYAASLYKLDISVDRLFGLHVCRYNHGGFYSEFQIWWYSIRVLRLAWDYKQDIRSPSNRRGLNKCYATFKSRNAFPWLCYTVLRIALPMVISSPASSASKTPASAPALAETPLPKSTPSSRKGSRPRTGGFMSVFVADVLASHFALLTFFAISIPRSEVMAARKLCLVDA